LGDDVKDDEYDDSQAQEPIRDFVCEA
jgi:hypothetical protein